MDGVGWGVEVLGKRLVRCSRRVISVAPASGIQTAAPFLDLVAVGVGVGERRQRVSRVDLPWLSCSMHDEGWGVPTGHPVQLVTYGPLHLVHGRFGIRPTYKIKG